MKLSKRYAGLLAAAAIVIPTASVAQEEVTDQANVVSETAQELQEETNALANVTADAEAEGAAAADTLDADGRDDRRDGDDDFPWGLLGLFGLAGLLGLKKRDDHHHRDVNVDTRRDSRPL